MTKHSAQIVAMFLIMTTARSASPSAKPTPPDGPMIQTRAPIPSMWAVISKPPTSSDEKGKDQSNASQQTAKEQPPAFTNQKTFIKGNRVMKVILEVSKGSPEIVWITEQGQVLEGPQGSNSFSRISSGTRDTPNPLYCDISQSDFPEMQWIDADSYTGETTYHGIKCLVFSKKMHYKTMQFAERDTLCTGLVEKESRLPVALDQDGELTEWNWQSPPAGGVVLPPSLTKFFAQQKKEASDMMKPAVLP